MNYSMSADSELSSASDWSNSSWFSNNSDFSVFVDDSKDNPNRIPPEKLRYSAQQLAVASASQHFPTFTNSPGHKCAKLHWACLVGWCLCKYQYQPLTPLHLLPNTPLTDYQVWLAASKKAESKPSVFDPDNPQKSVDLQLLKSKVEKINGNQQPNKNIVYEYESTV